MEVLREKKSEDEKSHDIRMLLLFIVIRWETVDIINYWTINNGKVSSTDKILVEKSSTDSILRLIPFSLLSSFLSFIFLIFVLIFISF